jgi:hypothetical protein
MEPLFFDRDLGRLLPEALRSMGVVVKAHRERDGEGQERRG